MITGHIDAGTLRFRQSPAWDACLPARRSALFCRSRGPAAAQEHCPLTAIGTAKVAAVRDGRTVLLADGRTLRLAAIEVTEQSRAALQALVGGRRPFQRPSRRANWIAIAFRETASGTATAACPSKARGGLTILVPLFYMIDTKFRREIPAWSVTPHDSLVNRFLFPKFDTKRTHRQNIESDGNATIGSEAWTKCQDSHVGRTLNGMKGC
jgi:hypothetical protein